MKRNRFFKEGILQKKALRNKIKSGNEQQRIAGIRIEKTK